MAILIALITQLFVVHAAPLKITIDPGHGGEDNGAVRGRIKESEVALKISNHLHTFLAKDQRFRSYLTRKINRTKTLKQRVQFAQKNGTQLFVSVHANASPDERSRGMEIYIRNELEPELETQRLANMEEKFAQTNLQKKNKPKGDLNAIIDDLQRSVNLKKSYEASWHIVKKWKAPHSKPRSHAIKQGPFYVLTQNEVPSMLVEVGFISNPKESKRLKTASYQKKIAKTIYNGLVDYYKTIETNKSKAL